MDRTFFLDTQQIMPSIQEVIDARRLDWKKLAPAFLIKGGQPEINDRRRLILSDGKKDAEWIAPSLLEMFRGNRVPPDMTQYPPDYVQAFFAVEHPLFLLGTGLRMPPTDQHLEEIFSNLKRRPDGRSLGIHHDVLWQSTALLMALNEVSRAEFEAIFARLALSAAAFSLSPVSRNLFEHWSQTIGR